MYLAFVLPRALKKFTTLLKKTFQNRTTSTKFTKFKGRLLLGAFISIRLQTKITSAAAAKTTNAVILNVNFSGV